MYDKGGYFQGKGKNRRLSGVSLLRHRLLAPCLRLRNEIDLWIFEYFTRFRYWSYHQRPTLRQGLRGR